MISRYLYLFLIGIFLSPGYLSAQEKYTYNVSFYSIPSLTMTMEISATEEIKRLDITTKTNSFFDKIFAIENHYSTLYHADSFSVIHHEKKIDQPNVVQQLTIDYRAEQIRYSNGERRVSPQQPLMDFFSFLMYLRHQPINRLDNVTIDMEGEFFDVSLHYLSDENIEFGETVISTHKIELIYQKIDNAQSSVLNYTDIFNWKIASESGKKYIWLEKGDRKRIIKARFSEGKSRLEATLVEE